MDKIAVNDLGTEQRILEAARNIFSVKGFSGARMQEIADAAGINKALLHYYFRNKEKLFQVIFQEALANLLPQVLEIFSLPIPLFEKIERFTEAYVDLFIRHPYIPGFVLSEMHRHPDTFFQQMIPPEMAARMRDIAGQFGDAANRGDIAAADPRQLMINILSLCIFPVVARPMLQRMMQYSNTDYDHMLEARKKLVSQFVIKAIQPENHSS